MKESILKRYPSLNPSDVSLQDDGQGVYISRWNSDLPKPSMSDVFLWYGEATPPKALEEQLTEKEREIRLLKEQQAQMNADLTAFMDELINKGVI